MKRTGFRKATYAETLLAIKAKQGEPMFGVELLISRNKPLRTRKLRVAGKSTVAEQKREIQRVLREIVMRRDGGCILRMERCGNELDTPGVVFQADHLIERSNSATYADHRLVVCVCKGCHGWKHFKKSNHDQYNALIREILPEARVKLWDKCEKESAWPTSKGCYDWGLEIVALNQELKRLTPSNQ